MIVCDGVSVPTLVVIALPLTDTDGDGVSVPTAALEALPVMATVVLGVSATAAFGPKVLAAPMPSLHGARGLAPHARAKNMNASRSPSAIDSPACTETWLRDALTNAADHDTITIPLDCSGISLTAGAIPIAVDNLTLVGPGADAFTLDGGAAYGFHDRVLTHLGKGTLTISGMTIVQ